MWKQFYNTASGGDGGTLYQLRNLINRQNVVKKPMDDLAACEDFAITVVEAHIVSAAMVIFDMKTADDRPCEKFFPTGCEKLDTVQRKKIFMLAIDELVKNYVNISVPQLPPESNADMSKVVTEYTEGITKTATEESFEGVGESTERLWESTEGITETSMGDNVGCISAIPECVGQGSSKSTRGKTARRGRRKLTGRGRGGQSESKSTSQSNQSVEQPNYDDANVENDSEDRVDRKYSYAFDLLSNGLILLDFIDAVREGDGKRIIRVWRFLMLVFKATNCYNYAIQAFTLLMQDMHLFSPWMKAQLEWNRTVNVHGRRGKNISADLFMEHLNRECKGILSGMYSNVSENSVIRISRALKSIHCVMDKFDRQNNVTYDSGVHHRKSSLENREKIVNQLVESKNFIKSSGTRKHKNFPLHKTNIMQTLNPIELQQWMKQKAETILTYC